MKLRFVILNFFVTCWCSCEKIPGCPCFYVQQIAKVLQQGTDSAKPQLDNLYKASCMISYIIITLLFVQFTFLLQDLCYLLYYKRWKPG